MPFNSVTQYVDGLINGITVPGIAGTLTSWVQPPVLENLNVNGMRAYVWASRVSASRQTMPRGEGAGFKKLPWHVQVWAVYETAADQDNFLLSQQFPCMLDAIAEALATTTMPLFITDPTTMQESQIQSVGEEWDLDADTARTPATMRMLWYGALFTNTILEVYQQ
jgi:hypothetical protein